MIKSNKIVALTVATVALVAGGVGVALAATPAPAQTAVPRAATSASTSTEPVEPPGDDSWSQAERQAWTWNSSDAVVVIDESDWSADYTSMESNRKAGVIVYGSTPLPAGLRADLEQIFVGEVEFESAPTTRRQYHEHIGKMRHLLEDLDVAAAYGPSSDFKSIDVTVWDDPSASLQQQVQTTFAETFPGMEIKVHAVEEPAPDREDLLW